MTEQQVKLSRIVKGSFKSIHSNLVHRKCVQVCIHAGVPGMDTGHYRLSGEVNAS